MWRPARPNIAFFAAPSVTRAGDLSGNGPASDGDLSPLVSVQTTGHNCSGASEDSPSCCCPRGLCTQQTAGRCQQPSEDGVIGLQ